jgi:hypothetical protein
VFRAVHRVVATSEEDEMTDISQSTSGYGALPSEQQDSPSMKDKATDTAGAAKGAAGDVAQTASDKAKDVVGEAKRQARDLVGEARDQVGSQVGDQHQNLVSNLHSLADELTKMAGASDQQGLAGEIVGQAGDRARTAADWLGNRQPGDLLDEVRSFARRRPGTFLVGALVAGVAVGRLTRGAVAAHTDDSSANGTAGASLDASETTVMPRATGYSAPPVHQGLPTEGGTAYGGASSSEITSGMPSPDIVPGMTPPDTGLRPPEPPAPGVGPA